MNRGADRDDLVGVYPLVRRLTAEILCDLNDLGHASHTAHEHEFIDLRRRKIGVFETVLEWRNAALEKRFANLLHFRPGKLNVQVLRARSVGGNKRQIDIDRQRR